MNLEEWFMKFPINNTMLNHIKSNIYYPRYKITQTNGYCVDKICCILSGISLDSSTTAKTIRSLYTTKPKHMNLEEYIIIMSKNRYFNLNKFIKIHTHRYWARIKYLLDWVKSNGYNLELN